MKPPSSGAALRILQGLSATAARLPHRPGAHHRHFDPPHAMQVTIYSRAANGHQEHAITEHKHAGTVALYARRYRSCQLASSNKIGSIINSIALQIRAVGMRRTHEGRPGSKTGSKRGAISATAGDVQRLKLLVEPHPGTSRNGKNLYGMQEVRGSAVATELDRQAPPASLSAKLLRGHPPLSNR
jgi:hypothetical protein